MVAWNEQERGKSWQLKTVVHSTVQIAVEVSGEGDTEMKVGERESLTEGDLKFSEVAGRLVTTPVTILGVWCT